MKTRLLSIGYVMMVLAGPVSAGEQGDFLRAVADLDGHRALAATRHQVMTELEARVETSLPLAGRPGVDGLRTGAVSRDPPAPGSVAAYRRTVVIGQAN